MMKRILLSLLALLALSGLTARAQQALQPLTKAELAKFTVKGNPLTSARYEDNTGTNYVILTRTKVLTQTKKTPSGEDLEFRSQYIYAYRFQLENGNPVQRWRITDYVQECDLDGMTVKFLDNGLRITDEDNDGIKEVWVAYNLDCAGDPGPSTMKIIMYEGKQKYAMRGTLEAQVVFQGEYQGGDYTLDAAFKNGPASIRNYAKEMWKEYNPNTAK